MESFKHLYLSACSDIHVSPDERILSATDTGSGDKYGCLDLSNYLLNNDTCTSVGMSFHKDVYITELKLSECMLHEEGLVEILKGLENNTSVISLDLKGNCIRSSGALALGKLLRHNSFIKRLELEWNSLGIIPEKFFIFCEGLAVNTSLSELNLKNNQLNTQCAESIANALMRNDTLHTLDLRFNNIGILGGKAMLKAFTANKSLISLDLSGNDIPSDVANYIEIAIMNNRGKRLMRSQHINEARLLANRLQEVESEKNSQLRTAFETLEQTEKKTVVFQRETAVKISELEGALEEEKLLSQRLLSENGHLKTLLASVQDKLDNSVEELKKLDEEKEKMKRQYYSNLKEEQDKAAEIDVDYNKKTGDLKRKARDLEEQIDELEKENCYQDDYIQKLTAANLKLKDQLKSTEANFNVQVEALRNQRVEALQEKESLRQTEITRIKGEYVEMERKYMQRIQNMELQRIEVEKEIFKLRGQLATEKLDHEEALSQQQTKYKTEEVKLQKQLEEKMNLLKVAKEKQEEVLKDQLQIMHDMQTKATALSFELDKQNHEIQRLQQCLAAADDDCKREVAKVKLDVKEQLEELAEVKKRNSDLLDEINNLKKHIEEITNSHLKELQAKDESVERLTTKLIEQQNKIQKVIAEEEKRASELKTAVMSYFSNITHTASEFS